VAQPEICAVVAVAAVLGGGAAIEHAVQNSSHQDDSGQKQDSNSNSGNDDNKGNKNGPNGEPPPPAKTGSYTNRHESGKAYHGKGDQNRAARSAKRVENEHNDKHASTETKSAPNDREAFKDEATRMRNDGGVSNPNNYNKINSPGEKYLEEDGEP
jgi:hypothetical protein